MIKRQQITNITMWIFIKIVMFLSISYARIASQNFSSQNLNIFF